MGHVFISDSVLLLRINLQALLLIETVTVKSCSHVIKFDANHLLNQLSVTFDFCLTVHHQLGKVI